MSPDTVLDFSGQQLRRFRFDRRYRVLLGCSRRQLEDQLAQGFPFLPPGCRLVLDRVSSERVLSIWRQCLPSLRPQLLEELRALAAAGEVGPSSGLAHWLDALAMDPTDFYAIRGAGFTALRRELGWLPPSCSGPAATGSPSIRPWRCSGRPMPGATSCASCCCSWPSGPITASIRCRDLALGPSLFHWESQSTTTTNALNN
jgi:hypothetical protein